MSVISGILRGAAKQGLSDIHATNEFYGDLIRTASAHIGSAAQSANNSWAEDVKGAEGKFNKYLSVVDALGKQKADYIFENTSYLDQDNYLELATSIPFALDFKYVARSEPVETMNKNVNANVNAVKNQINNASSMRGMSKVRDLYLGQLPSEYEFDTSRLPVSDGRIMTEAERKEQISTVILPTSLRTSAERNMGYVAMIDMFDGDIKKASATYGIPEADLIEAKRSIQKASPAVSLAASMLDTSNYKNALMNGTSADVAIEVAKMNETFQNLIKSSEAMISGVGMSSLEQAENVASSITDETEFIIGNEKITFGQLLKESQEDPDVIADAKERGIAVDKMYVLQSLFASGNFSAQTVANIS